MENLSGRRVLVPGGTGGVGEGVVRSYLAAGADVVVPTRTAARADEFRRVLGDAATDRLHLVVHDYTTFDGAEGLAVETERRLGGLDDAVAPIGGWWAGKNLWEVDEADWQGAFVGLATAHLAVARSVVPRLKGDGAYAVVVGASATTPVPGSGLVSMEQAAVLMMRQVMAAEAADRKRLFALILGPVGTRAVNDADPARVTADQVGELAVALSATPGLTSREVLLRNATEFEEALGNIENR